MQRWSSLPVVLALLYICIITPCLFLNSGAAQQLENTKKLLVTVENEKPEAAKVSSSFQTVPEVTASKSNFVPVEATAADVSQEAADNATVEAALQERFLIESANDTKSNQSASTSSAISDIKINETTADSKHVAVEATADLAGNTESPSIGSIEGDTRLKKTDGITNGTVIADAVPAIANSSVVSNASSQTVTTEAPLPIAAIAPSADEDKNAQHESIQDFDEWTKRKLQEQQQNKHIAESSGHGVPLGNIVPRLDARNYASYDCGAKVLLANAEATNAKSILNEKERDEYLLNPCNTPGPKWFVVELCETIQPYRFEIGNFELFSSSPKTFRVYASERYPSPEWTLLGEWTAEDKRQLQSFEIPGRVYAKVLKVDLLSHYGNQHFCPVSLVRVFGVSMVDEYEQENGSPVVASSLTIKLDSNNTDLSNLTLENLTGTIVPNAGHVGGDGKAAAPAESRDILHHVVVMAKDFISQAQAVLGIKSNKPTPTPSDVATIEIGSSVSSSLQKPVNNSLAICSWNVCWPQHVAHVPISWRKCFTCHRANFSLASCRFVLFLTRTNGDAQCDLVRNDSLLTLANSSELQPNNESMPAPPPSSEPVVQIKIVVGGESNQVKDPLPGPAASFILVHNAHPAVIGNHHATDSKQHTTAAFADSDTQKLTDTKKNTTPTTSAEHNAGPAMLPTKQTVGQSVVVHSPLLSSSTVPADENEQNMSDDAARESLLHPSLVDEILRQEPRQQPSCGIDARPPGYSPPNRDDASAAVSDKSYRHVLPDSFCVRHNEHVLCYGVFSSFPYDAKTKSHPNASTAPAEYQQSITVSTTTQAPLTASTIVPPQTTVTVTGPPIPTISTTVHPAVIVNNGFMPSHTGIPLPGTSNGQKESIFLRLNNRIKTLEQNISLSSQYLGELSRRYRKQIDDIQRAHNRTTRMLEEALAKMDVEFDRQRQESAELRVELAHMQDLAAVVQEQNIYIINELWKWHVAVISFEVILVACLLWWCVLSVDRGVIIRRVVQTELANQLKSLPLANRIHQPLANGHIANGHVPREARQWGNGLFATSGLVGSPYDECAADADAAAVNRTLILPEDDDADYSAVASCPTVDGFYYDSRPRQRHRSASIPGSSKGCSNDYGNVAQQFDTVAQLSCNSAVSYPVNLNSISGHLSTKTKRSKRKRPSNTAYKSTDSVLQQGNVVERKISASSMNSFDEPMASTSSSTASANDMSCRSVQIPKKQSIQGDMEPLLVSVRATPHIAENSRHRVSHSPAAGVLFHQQSVAPAKRPGLSSNENAFRKVSSSRNLNASNVCLPRKQSLVGSLSACSFASLTSIAASALTSADKVQKTGINHTLGAAMNGKPPILSVQNRYSLLQSVSPKKRLCG